MYCCLFETVIIVGISFREYKKMIGSNQIFFSSTISWVSQGAKILRILIKFEEEKFILTNGICLCCRVKCKRIFYLVKRSPTKKRNIVQTFNMDPQQRQITPAKFKKCRR